MTRESTSTPVFTGEYLCKGVFVIKYHGSDKGANEQIFNLESIEIGIVCGSKREPHEVKNVN